LGRKVKEFMLAVQIEKKFSKDQILQMYLNEAPYGGTAWGIGTAAEVYFKKPVSLIRVMPNMPALVGAGMSAFSLGKHAMNKHKKIAQGILSAIGEVVETPERMLDLVTAVSGSGPAYFFLLADCLIKACGGLGFTKDESRRLVEKTIEISCPISVLRGIRLNSQIIRYSKYMGKGKGCQAQNHDGI